VDAIYGFTGRPDPDLVAAMGSALTHRGSELQVLELPDVTLAWRGESRVAPLGQGAGTAQVGGVSVAVAGSMLGPESALEVAEAWARDGRAATSTWRGSFVVAIWDGRLHLIRDGVGVRTAYWGSHGGRDLFAVEPKGLLACPGFPRRLRHAAVAQYLSYSYTPGEGTLLEDVFELLPGHIETPGAGRQPFYDWWTDGPAEDEASFGRCFSEAVGERLPDRGPVGVFLSGGIDSSVVTAELVKQAPGRIQSFALHFGKKLPNELEFARAVADRCGTEHHEVEIRPKDFLPRLRQTIWHLDEPIGDPITIPNHELARVASERVPMIFNGEGGDPILGGPKNLGMLLHHWYGVPREPRWRERRYLASYRRAWEEVPRLLTPEFRETIDEARDVEGILTPWFDAVTPPTLLDKLLTINLRLKGAHLILPKVDRMTAAVGLPTAAPLFDDRLVQASFRLPAHLKVHGGDEKIVLKNLYRDALPASVIDRPKSGMRVPVHAWFQGPMKAIARDVLAPKRLKRDGIWNPDRVRQLLAYNTSEGPGRYGLRLWMLLTFELWRRMVVDGEAP
jgi:asparagine synthase (glutamine-hydrolysing)